MTAFKLKNRINGTNSQTIKAKSYFYEVTGTIHEVGQIKTYKKDFRVRSLTILDEEFNPQPLVFQLLQKDVHLADSFKTGTRVKVTFKLSGRFGTGEWEGRTFTNLRLTKIQKIMKMNFLKIIQKMARTCPSSF